MGSRKLKVQGMMELSQAVAYLEDVLQSLKEGAIRVESGNEVMSLNPGGIVDFEMQLSQKKEKEKFSLEISWKLDAKSPSREDLKISS